MATTIYKYKNGESLTCIAKRFNTNIPMLVKLNKWLISSDGHTQLYPSRVTDEVRNENHTGQEDGSLVQLLYRPLIKGSLHITLKLYSSEGTEQVVRYFKDDGEGNIYESTEEWNGRNENTALLSYGKIEDYEKGQLRFSIGTPLNIVSCLMTYRSSGLKKDFLNVPIIGNGNTSIEDYWENVSDVTGIPFSRMMNGIATDYSTILQNEGKDISVTLKDGKSDISNSTIEMVKGIYADEQFDSFIEDKPDFSPNVATMGQIVQSAINVGSANHSKDSYTLYNPKGKDQSIVNYSTNLTINKRSPSIISYSTLGHPNHVHGIGDQVQVIIGGTTLYMPCYPSSVQDGTSAEFSSETVLGRSQPYYIYSHTSGRSIVFTFDMHREMLGESGIKLLESYIRIIEAAVYPNYSGTVAPIRTKVKVGNSIYISGVMSDEKTTWDDRIGPDNKYDKVQVTFTVLEVSDEAFSFSDICAKGGYRT